ncbi:MULTISPECIES: hypothetical protein [unclassified Pantoea]|jgi:sulfonate transport system substrate-binding protein|uniref:hypothetical protein n=1 Tax=unclassified Pantoea TaxID=2630326 RepID=UPI001F450447|nr:MULTISPECIES: hypothetical protein [unclassified Pantoea]
MRLAALFTGVALAISTLHPLFAADKVTLRLGDVKGDRFAALKSSGELNNLSYGLELTAFDPALPGDKS